MVASVEVGLAAGQTDDDLKSGGTTDTTKNTSSSTKTNTSGTTNNSGSVNTTDVLNNNTTTNSGSLNVTNNSGTSVNTTSGSTNTQTNSGSTNKTENSGSTQVIEDSGSVNTSQLMLTQDAVDHITRQILEGTSGLATTSKGDNVSGSYGTTARTLLANDLISRTAGEVAARSAVTKQVIGGSTKTITNSGSSSTTNIGGSTSSVDIGGNTSTNSTNGSSVTSVGGSTSTNSGSSKGTNTIGASSSTFDQSSDAETISAEQIKSIISGWSERDVRETKETVQAKGGWILCTELVRQHRMDKRHYVYGLKEFNSYSESSKNGYYIWAVPALKHLREKPFSLLSIIICKLLCARAEYIAADNNCTRANKTVLGFISKQLYWGCWLLGKTVARNYNISEACHG